MSNYITEADALISSLPFSVTQDEDKEKLAKIVAEELIKTVELTDKALFLSKIKELSEDLLDILAYDFKVEWYDVKAPIENKRKAIEECIIVHKYKGTKYAVETALHSMFKDAKVEEWFEYGGEPFHFKLTVYGGSSAGGLKNLYQKLQYSKNLRSVMESVVFVISPDSPAYMYAGVKLAGMTKRIGARISSDKTGG